MSDEKTISLDDASDRQVAAACKGMGFDESRRLQKYVYGDPRTEEYTPAIRKGAIVELKKCGVTGLLVREGLLPSTRVIRG